MVRFFDTELVSDNSDDSNFEWINHDLILIFIYSSLLMLN